MISSTVGNDYMNRLKERKAKSTASKIMLLSLACVVGCQFVMWAGGLLG